MTLWQQGDVVGPTNLNARGGSVTTIGGFSSNTFNAESGNTISTGTYPFIIRSVDSGGAFYNVKAFGALGDGNTDDAAAIRSAISAANFAAGSSRSGAVVYFPTGNYVYKSTLQVPVLVSGSITLKGAGMRSTYLFPSGLSSNFSKNSDGDPVCLVFGTLTPDNENIFTNQTNYCGMEDMSQSGSILTDTSYVAHQITEMQYGWMRNCIIEAFPNNSIGLYLRGANLISSIGTEIGPHVRLCNFINCLVTNIGSNNQGGRPVLLQNADENAFFGCTAAIATGQSIATDSAFAVWIQSGRNNRFYGCLEQGDTTTKKTGYCGWVLGPPQTRSGTSAGVVLMNQMYGDVLEGFDIPIWFQKDGTSNVRGNIAFGINPSITNSTYSDANAVGGALGNGVFSALLTPPLNYFDGPMPTPSGSGQFTINSATPSAAGNNVFAFANSSPSTITSFTNTVPNQIFWARLDTNTTIRDSNNGGNGDIQCWGRKDITGQLNMWVPFIRFQNAPATYQVGPPVQIANAATNTFNIPVPIGMGDGALLTPSYTFSSELSLGFIRSASSVLALTYGQLAAPGGNSAQPSFAFNSNRSTGFYDNGTPGMDIAVAGGVSGRALTGQWAVVSGSAVRPALAFTSETSLGLFRSASSTAAMSYGTLSLNQAYLASVKTAASVSSAILGTDAWAVANPANSGASICININGVMYIFNSSGTTIGR
jgi:Pectate lyase superfamily protein